MKRFATYLIVSLLAGTTALAQKHPTIELGFNAERLYQFHDLDSVNLFNGNLIVRIPIGSSYRAEGGFQYGLTLVYNSKVWDYLQQDINDVRYTYAEPNWRSNAGIGWRLSLGRLFPPSAGGSYSPLNDTNSWVYEDASGAEHPFGLDSGATLMTSFDQDRLRMVRLSATEREIEFPSGERHTFKMERERWRLRKIRDRYENALTVESVWLAPGDPSESRESGWILGDGLGRTHEITFVSYATVGNSVDEGQHVSRIRFSTLGAAVPLEYNFEYEYVDPAATPSLATPWGCGHYPNAGAGEYDGYPRLPLLKKLTLPDQTSFDFTYYNASTAQSGGFCSQGALASMTLPTRGSVAYHYQELYMPESFCWASSFGDKNPAVRSRTIAPGGRWDYVLTHAPAENVDFVQAQRDCGVGPEHPTLPSPAVQSLHRWARMTVLSPPVPFRATPAAPSELRRVRTDNFFYVWPKEIAPPDPLNPVVPNGPVPVSYAQPMTTGAPPLTALGPVTVPDVQAPTDVPSTNAPNVQARHLSTRSFEGCVNETDPTAITADCTNGRVLQSNYLRLPALDSIIYRTSTYPPDATRTEYHDDNTCGGPCWVQMFNLEPNGAGKFKRSILSSNFGGVARTEREVFTGYSAWTPSMKVALTSGAPTHRWILDLHDRTERTVQGVAAISEACFDATTGWLQGSRTWAGSGRGANDVLNLFQYDSRGNLQFEKSYGGDVQSLPTSTACSPPAGSPTYLRRYVRAGSNRGDDVEGEVRILRPCGLESGPGHVRFRADDAGREPRRVERSPCNGARQRGTCLDVSVRERNRTSHEYRRGRLRSDHVQLSA
jgi:hypothetical protein